MAAAALHGFFLALGLILPLGVQNVFVFNQGALQRRYHQALPIILTACLCDTLLITAAVAGVSVLLLASPLFGTVLMGAGVIFLLYMGTVTWKSRPDTAGGRAEAFPAKRQISFGLFVSLLNPHAIMDTVGVIGTSSLAYGGWDKAAFGASCVLVSWLWFFGLAGAGRLAGALDRNGSFLPVLNKISALVMWGAAFFMALQLIR
ncbi:LysE/ArgO family amino acid transporter [Gorillibacterium sp. sgz5001074]|uniref:LysE/ArgO family amino acid transporter n=1 Tax=Gorillibacterium sp. sgz5001074 TaxID=3446695 RepID=UPI003F67254F